MVQDRIILMAKKHKDWINIVKSFGCKQIIAEDIVQEMYIKLQIAMEKGLDIAYDNNDVNYYYVYKTLKTLFLDLKRKGKGIEIVSLDEVRKDRDTKIIVIEAHTNDTNYIDTYNLIEKHLSKMYWYDRKVFEIINGGESIASFSRKTNIPYYSLYNTYNRIKNKLKKLI